MRYSGYLVFCFLQIFFLSVHAQELQDRLRQHVQFLSDDLMQGRMTGSREEMLCATYLFSRWATMGYKPMFGKSFVQPFPFPLQRTPDTNLFCQINGKYIDPKNIKVLPFSGNKKAKGQVVHLSSDSLLVSAKASVKGVVVCLSAESLLKDPHLIAGGAAALRSVAERAERAGAKGVVFSSSAEVFHKTEWSFTGFHSLAIPVLLVADFPDNVRSISMKGGVKEEWATGRNVAAWLNRNRPSTIILGAHYDHLGWGENGHSLSTEIPAIHNGADDNASGVAAILEISRLLAKDTSFPHNIIVVAFSGEELGLLGSKHFVRHAPVDWSAVQCMLNFDMVGRIDSSSTLILNGVGTSPFFSDWVKNYKGFFHLKTTESGMGPSDHSSFYQKDIPVLHFFSGLHQDYHKPQDDESKLNYKGLEELVQITTQLLHDIPGGQKLAFTKTKDAKQETAPRFKVTLGIMPDYAYSGKGVRADGISEGKPAAMAGLQPGDVIIGIGEYSVEDMMGYMQALSQFSKGTQTHVRFLRNKQPMQLDIQF